MSIANFIINDPLTNKPEFKVSNTNIDMSEIECDNLIVHKSIQSQQIDDIGQQLTNIQQEITVLRNEMTTFKNDVLASINDIKRALLIDHNNEKLTTPYTLHVEGNLRVG